jgi:hypothetical protein
MEYDELPLEHLRVTGLLFEINRRVLHPYGFALALSYDDATKRVDGMRLICTKDQEGITYPPETFEEANARLQKFLDDEGNGKIECRLRALGFIEQTE